MPPTRRGAAPSGPIWWRAPARSARAAAWSARSATFTPEPSTPSSARRGPSTWRRSGGASSTTSRGCSRRCSRLGPRDVDQSPSDDGGGRVDRRLFHVRVLVSRRGHNCRAQCAKVGVPRGVGTTGPPSYQRMRGSKILITGPTGQLATPIALALAADNEVWGVARFTNPAAREALENAGIRCQAVNLAAGDFTGLPSDFDYVLNLAVAKSGDWDTDLGANAESVGLLMAHCRGVKAFLHCSSAAVYDPPDDEPRTERAALGDNHKSLFPTYSISKIAGEVVARSMARALGVPTTVARLNVPYGDNGGWPYYHMEMILAGIPIPVPPGGPARYNPLHEGDIIATVPKLLAGRSVP